MGGGPFTNFLIITVSCIVSGLGPGPVTPGYKLILKKKKKNLGRRTSQEWNGGSNGPVRKLISNVMVYM